jgi:urease accessory protein
MPIVESAIEGKSALKRVFIEVDRFQLQKCRFRCKAQDGMDFAFALENPLKNGDCVFETGTHCYELKQLPEKVIRVALPVTPSDAAQLAWQIGNFHQPVDIRDTYLLVSNDPALHRVLKKLDLKFDTTTEVFSPPPHSAFPAHQHVPGLEYDHSHFFGASHGTAV